MSNSWAQISLDAMDVEEAWKYKRDWKELRRKSLGEILQLKFHGRSPYDRELAEMELKRRTLDTSQLQPALLRFICDDFPVLRAPGSMTTEILRCQENFACVRIFYR